MFMKSSAGSVSILEVVVGHSLGSSHSGNLGELSLMGNTDCQCVWVAQLRAVQHDTCDRAAISSRKLG